MNFCSLNSILSFKHRYVIRKRVMDELPVVGADKIDKRLLKERYWKDERFKV